MSDSKNKFHELKILPVYFEAVISGDKSFEIRKDDRDFNQFDTLYLREYLAGAFTGRMIICRVNYILGCFEGLQAGYVAMAIERMSGVLNES